MCKGCARGGWAWVIVIAVKINKKSPVQISIVRMMSQRERGSKRGERKRRRGKRRKRSSRRKKRWSKGSRGSGS